MRAWSIVVACLLATGSVRAIGADVEDMFVRAQLKRMHDVVGQVARESHRAAIVRDTFAAVRDSIDADAQIEILIVEGDVVAEVLGDHLIAASESLALLPEGERAFVMAHELGHILLGHGSKRTELLRQHPNRHVPHGPDELRAVPLEPAASELAHRQELEADAFALRAIRKLGHGSDSALALFARQAVLDDTATHPRTPRRIAHLLDDLGG